MEKRQEKEDPDEVEAEAVAEALAEAWASAGVCFSSEGEDQSKEGNQRWVSFGESSQLPMCYAIGQSLLSLSDGICSQTDGMSFADGRCSRDRGH